MLLESCLEPVLQDSRQNLADAAQHGDRSAISKVCLVPLFEYQDSPCSQQVLRDFLPAPPI
eukprot:239148-Alexandrium_andersonii.AAC.1